MAGCPSGGPVGPPPLPRPRPCPSAGENPGGRDRPPEPRPLPSVGEGCGEGVSSVMSCLQIHACPPAAASGNSPRRAAATRCAFTSAQSASSSRSSASAGMPSSAPARTVWRGPARGSPSAQGPAAWRSPPRGGGRPGSSCRVASPARTKRIDTLRGPLLAHHQPPAKIAHAATAVSQGSQRLVLRHGEVQLIGTGRGQPHGNARHAPGQAPGVAARSARGRRAPPFAMCSRTAGPACSATSVIICPSMP